MPAPTVDPVADELPSTTSDLYVAETVCWTLPPPIPVELVMLKLAIAALRQDAGCSGCGSALCFRRDGFCSGTSPAGAASKAMSIGTNAIFGAISSEILALSAAFSCSSCCLLYSSFPCSLTTPDQI